MTTPRYELVDVDGKGYHEKHWGIQILEGDYEGVIFQFDTVKVEGDEGDEDMYLTFNTINIDVPDDVVLTEEKSSDIFGGILQQIMLEQVENLANADGTTDTEESTEQ